MITQERACKLQCLLQIQCQISRSNYSLKTVTKYKDMKFDQPKLILTNLHHKWSPEEVSRCKVWIPLDTYRSYIQSIIEIIG